MSQIVRYLLQSKPDVFRMRYKKGTVSIKDLKLPVAYKHSRAGTLSSSVDSNIFLYPSFIFATIFLDVLTIEYPRHLSTRLIAPSFTLGSLPIHLVSIPACEDRAQPQELRGFLTISHPYQERRSRVDPNGRDPSKTLAKPCGNGSGK
jgi:hypothetical protein